MNATQTLRLVSNLEVNPIQSYKEVDLEIKRLEKIKEIYRKQILDLLDNSKTDVLSLGEYKAERKLVVQSRFDTSLAKKVLSESQLAQLQRETSFVKLTVI